VQYTIDDVPMHDTLAGLEALVAPQLRARQLALSYEPCASTIAARADRDKLTQVVLNLLGNAIKYTPAGGTIVLGCDVDERHVHVRVRDDGPGIPAERLRAIFEPFVQGNRALNRPHEGVGLGLAISRDLARGMDGDVSVDSTLDHGSTFTLTLPRARDLAVTLSRRTLGRADLDPARRR
jgi:signal transduction histidine kinase